MKPGASGSGIERKRLSIRGVVQGIGFRPFVWRRASAQGLTGFVANDSAGVVAEIQGPADAVARFLEGFAAAAPALARIDRMEVVGIASSVDGPGDAFAILESRPGAGATASVPPDLGPCDACLAEIRDPADRRFRHPFASCTQCGPRATIVTALPFDRERTTMAGFPLCATCTREYRDPADRRFHAQTIACPACGPQVWLETPGGDRTQKRDAAIQATRTLLRDGAIVAIKGVGGFHLACDATSDAAVGRLRERKRRPGKAFAVLVADLDAARAIARVNALEERLLRGPERPIVLLDRIEGGLSALVAPGSRRLGVLLPPSPLHWLLAEGMPGLVLTSGNLAEEPIRYREELAPCELGFLVDAFLMHDRPIRVPSDDSVLSTAAGDVLPVRRSRGAAPVSVALSASMPCVLAVGGDMKATLCVTDGDRAIVSPHLGDMGHPDALDRLRSMADWLLAIVGREPVCIAADLHPGYLSVAVARTLAEARGIPLVRIQHHEAHLAALAAEHRRLGTQIVGVCFDGTGYGRDGTVQGGEFLTRGGSWQPGTENPFVRAAHLDRFLLPGGDACIRHPWRTALGLLHAAGVDPDERLPCMQAVERDARAIVERQIARSVACTPSSSMGRLFDGIAAIAGVCQSITHEAEAAMRLEALASSSADPGAYRFGTPSRDPARIDWRPVVRAAARDTLAGVPAADVAIRFHRGVAAMIAEECARLRAAGGGDVVGLTGGVFQNVLLVELAREALDEGRFEVLLHRVVPPGDGGLSLGQAVLAAEALTSAARRSAR